MLSRKHFTFPLYAKRHPTEKKNPEKKYKGGKKNLGANGLQFEMNDFVALRYQSDCADNLF